jgi:hypothetical protein
VILPPGVPGFVSEIIKEWLQTSAGKWLSFINIFETLKKNSFRIMAGVDFEEVSTFVHRVESTWQACAN